MVFQGDATPRWKPEAGGRRYYPTRVATKPETARRTRDWTPEPDITVVHGRIAVVDSTNVEEPMDGLDRREDR
jgi:hypothetical protein